MNGPSKKTGGLPTALKVAELGTPYRFSIFSQVFCRRKTATRRCTACDSRITNRNLGGNGGRSALSGELWCLNCADYPRQLVFSFGRSEP